MIANSTAQTLPDGLVEALGRLSFKYTPVKAVLYCVWIGSGEYVGVVGDGANGAYEMFHYCEFLKKAEASNDGFGSSSVALARALKKWSPE